jgi:catechol 2,3-dioxygenase
MKSKIRGLGEIALRVENLDLMQQFYEDIVGLELMKRFDNMAFFRIADGYQGHTQVLALFDRSGNQEYNGLDSEKSTSDHFAFSISLENFDAEKDRLEGLGVTVETSEHAWVKWRSLYFKDPEGNQVEFVCYDGGIE